MIIRRSSTNTLVIENSQNKSSVTVKSLDGQLLVKVSNGSSDIEISKPGDYEYFGLGVTGFEVPIDKYSSIINLVKINIEGVRIVLVTQFREVPKDILTNLANIDILAIPIVNSIYTKTIVNVIEPKKLVLIKNFGGEEVELDSVIKSVGIQIIEEVTSIKNKSVDFAASSEEFILMGEVLI